MVKEGASARLEDAHQAVDAVPPRLLRQPTLSELLSDLLGVDGVQAAAEVLALREAVALRRTHDGAADGPASGEVRSRK